MTDNGKEKAYPMLDPNGSFIQYGLSKREYFAGIAMSLYKGFDPETTAQMAIKTADELLKQLDSN